MLKVRKFGCTLILVHAWVVSSAWAAGKDLQAQARLLMNSPDVTVSGTYDLPARLEVLDRMLSAPYLLAKLWGAYRFSPAYTARPAGEGIHVNDPTGIAGDIYLVQQTANRRVYVGTGALNHDPLPAFGGQIALVLTVLPKGQAVSAHVAIYVRTDSRMLGFLTWVLFPLLKDRVEARMTANAASLGALLKDLSVEPQKAAALLQKQDAAALLKILPPRPPPPKKK